MSLIKLDFDGKFPYVLGRDGSAERAAGILGLHYEGGKVEPSKTKGNYHATVWFREELTDWEIVAIQAILGSDPVRETFNLRRIRRGQKNWNILFEK